jgi:hypothetical protein
LEEWDRQMRLRFYIDPETDEPHVYNHQVAKEEVADVLSNPGEDRRGRDGSRVAIGRTNEGRYLRVVYVLEPLKNSAFVITAYELTGQPLLAYRRRRRRKR